MFNFLFKRLRANSKYLNTSVRISPTHSTHTENYTVRITPYKFIPGVGLGSGVM